MLEVFEYIGSITALIYVFLATRRSIWNWPFAILSILCYIYVFFISKLYGDCALQFYFLGTSIYGWYFWAKTKKEAKSGVTVKSFNSSQIGVTILITLLLFLVIYYLLVRYTDTDVALVDAFCTAMSVVAQILLARKVIQNWYFWIIIDLVYIPLYLYKDLYKTAILYGVFLILCFMGAKQWRKEIKA